ncbi:hypothetical protein D3C72_1972970 [compost metagenome]
MRQRVGLGHVAGAGANDDAQLDLPIGLERARRDAHVVVGAAECGDCFHEQYGLGGRLHAGLFGVVGVI